MSFIGGILGVLASVAVLCMLRKLTRKDFLMLFDLMLLFVPLGIFFEGLEIFSIRSFMGSLSQSFQTG